MHREETVAVHDFQVAYGCFHEQDRAIPISELHIHPAKHVLSNHVGILQKWMLGCQDMPIKQKGCQKAALRLKKYEFY
jgi:hypothetical protein